MRLLLIALTLAATVLPVADAMAARPSVQAHGSRFGTVLFDGNGRALYLFTKDGRRTSACSGACARAWPPLIAHGSLRAGRGARRSLLGSTRRADGSRQVTYAGHPLYRYVGDTRAGQILCQDVFEYGGRWLVVGPDGRAAR